MNEHVPAAPFQRPYAVDQIPDAGLTDRIEANAGERAAIAELLALESLDRLVFDFALKPHGRGRVGLKGRVEAAATQACVVTLEPVLADIAQEVETRFWPESDIVVDDSGAHEMTPEASDDVPEPIVDGVIDLGQFAYETFAAELDPYPRREGAEFRWQEAAGEGEGSDDGGPFAALKALKRS